MKTLWSDWPAVSRRILPGKGRLLVLLDFDGTLAPIVQTPSEARMGLKVRRLLARLNGHPRIVVGVLSGRSLMDVERRVGLKALYYGGNHGLELKGPGIHFQHPGAFLMLPALVEAERGARRIFQGVPGALVEPKGLSVALHDRRVPSTSAALFRRRFKALKAGAGKPLAWRRGRRVWEGLPPVDWNKGRAADLLFRHVGAEALLAVGDDATDEDMFRAAKGRGVSVRVDPEGATGADYVLPTEADVPALLTKVSEALEDRP